LAASNYQDITEALQECAAVRAELDTLALEGLSDGQIEGRLGDLRERFDAARSKAGRGLPPDWVEREIEKHNSQFRR
jgi:hypothetical protein